MSSPTPVRFPQDLDRAVAEYARRTGLPKSRAADEWLRLQAHPGIHFVTTSTGDRRAALAGGPQVWTVAESWLQHEPADRTAEVIADAVGLSASAVEAALGYWTEHRAEIDQIIELHQSDQDAALQSWERRQVLRAR